MNSVGEGSEKGHSLLIENRARLALTGIEDVISFDERTVVLASTAGLLTIDGESLHIIQMNIDSKELGIEGKVNGISYIDKPIRRSGLLRSKK